MNQDKKIIPALMELTCRGLGFCSSGFQEGCRGREMQDDKSRFPFCACVHAGRACTPGGTRGQLCWKDWFGGREWSLLDL